MVSKGGPAWLIDSEDLSLEMELRIAESSIWGALEEWESLHKIQMLPERIAVLESILTHDLFWYSELSNTRHPAYDRYFTKTPYSRFEKKVTLRDLLAEFDNESIGIPERSSFIREAEWRYGIDPMFTEEWIEKSIRAGKIMRPDPGYLRHVQ